VTAWKVVTGGIHLDGLADSLDGLGGREPDRRLAIMRDSRIGVFGAAGIALVLLLFVTALAELAVPMRSRLLLLAPVVGRVIPVLAGTWLRPATPGQGQGALFAAGVSRCAGFVHAVVVVALGAWLLGPWGAAIAGAAGSLALLWAGFAARHLGGVTGDVLGGTVELGELAVVLLGVMAVHRGYL